MNDKLERIENILKQKGYKNTVGRKEIIKVFINNMDRHLKIEEIYEMVKKSISLPTVYRTIEILKKFGIIKEIVIEKDRYYELRMFSEKCLHVHFKCLKCGTIFDYNDKKFMLQLIDVKDKLEKRHDFTINNISIIYNGFCKKCRG